MNLAAVVSASQKMLSLELGLAFFLSTAITCKAFKITKKVSVDILCPFKLPCVLVSFPLAFYLPGGGRVALL